MGGPILLHLASKEKRVGRVICMSVQEPGGVGREVCESEEVRVLLSVKIKNKKGGDQSETGSVCADSYPCCPRATLFFLFFSSPFTSEGRELFCLFFHSQLLQLKEKE